MANEEHLDHKTYSQEQRPRSIFVNVQATKKFPLFFLPPLAAAASRDARFDVTDSFPTCMRTCWRIEECTSMTSLVYLALRAGSLRTCVCDISTSQRLPKKLRQNCAWRGKQETPPEFLSHVMMH